MEEMVDRLNEDVINLKEENKDIKEVMKQLQSANTSLQQRVENMESQSWRNDLSVRGLADVNGETWEQCEDLVRKTLSDKLDMNEDDVKLIPMERAHRLPGRQCGGGKYTLYVIVKFSFSKDREKTLQAALTKKPDGLFIMEDLTKAVRTVRGKLKDMRQEAREKGSRAYFSQDKLVVINDEGKRNSYSLLTTEPKEY